MSKDRSFATAIHILTALAYQAPKLVTSEELAMGLQTNAGLVRRMVGKLAAAGLVDTTLGKSGGSTLKKNPKDITMAEIFLAIQDAPIFGTFDKEPFKNCKVSCNMGDVLEKLFSELEAGLVRDMNKIRLAHVLDQIG